MVKFLIMIIPLATEKLGIVTETRAEHPLKALEPYYNIRLY